VGRRKGSLSFIAVIVALAALCFPASAPAPPPAPISLGQIAPMGAPGGCGGCNFFQLATDPASPSYVVPAAGTIAAWSARGGPTTDDASRFLVFRPTGVAGQFRLVAESPEVPVPTLAAPVFPVSIPVEAGDHIGVRTGLGGGDMPGIHPAASAGDVIAGVMGNIAVGQTAGPGGDFAYLTQASDRLNVAATFTVPYTPFAGPQKKKKCKKGKKRVKRKGKVRCVKKKKKKGRRG
jgi:hypothetical protein